MRGNFIYKKIGRRISATRKKRGLTQEALSGISCLHRTHIARIENGSIKPSLHTLIILARKLDVKVCYLLEGI
ncbi:transcriptional regulator [Candidatus Roizmanbacteria bacterium CG_4_10_14_0_8_um_filter_39_9]|uniref:Transcriptional regulator n=1 Tax=Candidatus Roizmanbacteria bacterium CG_4_10_14_0_8_um_filter_39_9 TaxID=1974829 RepID=A0A2M7QDM0_9BACT|nr:MAG: transcriptional regulator [Candidatus Roizmanbacteria bacterium CG_4_10_14_0_8_um_filter_39_9]